MKIRITEPGWGGYTGHLGSVEFVNGVSVDDVGNGDAQALAGILSVVDDKTGRNPSVAQRIIDQYDNAAVVEKPVEGVAFVAPVAVHTKESLEAIADASGIKGIREIAEPMGIKGNSITELIEKVLKVQTDAAV